MNFAKVVFHPIVVKIKHWENPTCTLLYVISLSIVVTEEELLFKTVLLNCDWLGFLRCVDVRTGMYFSKLSNQV